MKLIDLLNSRLDSQALTLEKFTDRLNQHPLDALLYGEDAVTAAARTEVLTYIIEGLESIAREENPCPPEKALATIDREAEISVINTLNSNSTSDLHNLVIKRKGWAWADIWMKKDPYGPGYRQQFIEEFDLNDTATENGKGPNQHRLEAR